MEASVKSHVLAQSRQGEPPSLHKPALAFGAEGWGMS